MITRNPAAGPMLTVCILSLFIVSGPLSAGCQQHEPVGNLRERLASLQDIAIPAISQPGLYSPEYVLSCFHRATAISGPLLDQPLPPELGPYVHNMKTNLQQAARLLEPWNPTGTEEFAGSTFDALDRIESALFYARAIAAHAALERDPDGFKADGQRRIAQAASELDARRQLHLELNRSETSLPRYLALPPLSRVLEAARTDNGPAHLHDRTAR